MLASDPASRMNQNFKADGIPRDSAAVENALIENCKLSGINPHTWMTKTLAKLAAGYPATAVGELMPWTSVG